LWKKGGVTSDPWVRGVEVLQGVLLLVLPLHMTLFVVYRIPPDVQQTVAPFASSNEEGAEVEAGTILGYDEVNGGWVFVTAERARERVEPGLCERVRDVERIEEVDVAVGI
jgi:hypothetical protein